MLQMPPKQLLRIYNSDRSQKKSVIVDSDASEVAILNEGM